MSIESKLLALFEQNTQSDLRSETFGENSKNTSRKISAIQKKIKQNGCGRKNFSLTKKVSWVRV